MKIVIVGFKVKEDNSVFYRKIEVLNDGASDDKLFSAFWQAVSKSDFISIRIVRDEK